MKNTKFVKILEMLVLIAAGVLVMMHPGGSLNVAVRILGFALLIYGIFAAAGYFMNEQKNRSVTSLAIGVAAVIGGIVVLAGPEFVISIFPIVAGVTVAVIGVRDLIHALNMKKQGAAFWKKSLILSIITVAFGILIFANPFGTMETVTVVLGIALIYNGIVGLITLAKA